MRFTFTFFNYMGEIGRQHQMRGEGRGDQRGGEGRGDQREGERSSAFTVSCKRRRRVAPVSLEPSFS